MVYRASRDPRAVAALSASAIVLFLGGATLALAGPDLKGSRAPSVIAGAFFMAASIAGAASSLVLRRYELTRFELIVRAGWRTKRIPLECIEGVLPVFRESPHVTIVYQTNGRPAAAIVTPQEPHAFLRDLEEATPFLERVGDRLLRKPALLVER